MPSFSRHKAEPPKNNKDPQVLYSGLAGSSSDAIVYVHRKTCDFLAQWRVSRRIPTPDLEEIATDAIVMMIQKIETGAYRFEGIDPCAYAAGVAKNMVFNFLRKQRPGTLEIQEWDALEMPAVEQYLHGKEVQAFIKKALDSMPENCRKLITLFHLENKSDEEVVQEKLTANTTVESVRSKRSECMKKLRQMASPLKPHL